MEKESIVHKKWLEVKLVMVASSNALVKSKIRMKEYAEELGDWEVIVDKEGVVSESGNRVYEIKAIPKGGKISPEGFRVIKDKLLGFAFDLLVHIKEEEEEMITYVDQPVNFLEAKKPEDIEGEMVICDTLIIDYFLKDRLELEKKEVNLAKSVFFETFEERVGTFKLKTGFFNNFSQKKQTIEMKERYKERLKSWFNIRLK